MQECKYLNTVKVSNFYLISVLQRFSITLHSWRVHSDFIPERKEYSHYVQVSDLH